MGVQRRRDVAPAQPGADGHARAVGGELDGVEPREVHRHAGVNVRAVGVRRVPAGAHGKRCVGADQRGEDDGHFLGRRRRDETDGPLGALERGPVRQGGGVAGGIGVRDSAAAERVGKRRALHWS